MEKLFNARLPKHIAIIMDGNGRWAKKRLLPRVAGHQKGTESVRAVVATCVKKKIEVLTLFAFSSENWFRPSTEVNFLLSLFLKSFQKNEIQDLINNNVRLNIIGDRTRFSAELKEVMREAEHLTENNTGLCVNIALNYGGRWDILQAARHLGIKLAAGEIAQEDITEEAFQAAMSLGKGLQVDLLIRTSGEQRISNFLLWDIAYTELYFTETLWPDFRETELEEALLDFATRQRRFGHTTEQIANGSTGAEAVSNFDSAFNSKSDSEFDSGFASDSQYDSTFESDDFERNNTLEASRANA